MGKFLAALLAYAAIAAATPYTSTNINQRDTEPCAQAEQGFEQNRKISIDLAIACLRSTPLDKANTIHMVQTYMNMTSLASDIAYLKKASPGMLYPPVDVNAGLADVVQKLSQDHYKNEFDVHLEIAEIMMATHNYHNVYDVDILNVFIFNRPFDLIPVSKDGTSLPDVYVRQDLGSDGKLKQNASPISQIDGMDVETWLNNYATERPYDHDPDASYSQIFYDSSNPTQKNLGIFTQSSYPFASTTNITYTNSTQTVSENFATTDWIWDNVTDGASFMRAFCLHSTNSTSSNARRVKRSEKPVATMSSTFVTVTEASTTTLAPFASVTPYDSSVSSGPFPAAYLADEVAGIHGYLPASPKDLLILKLSDFGDSADDDGVVRYQNHLRSLLATAQAQGRKRLIMDVRGNNAGLPELAIDVFMHIWPSNAPSLTFNERSTAELRAIADTVYDYRVNASDVISDAKSWNASWGVANDTGTIFDKDTYLDKDKHNFTTPQSFYGLNEKDNNGDGYTALLQYRLDSISRPGWIQLPGYLDNKTPIPQIFQASDIIFFTDGMCGGACADAAELFKSVANVKSIVVGGRKQNGPMQAVGGSKGRMSTSLSDLMGDLQAALLTRNSSLINSIKASAPGILDDDAVLWQRSNGGDDVFVNMQNTIRVNDTSLTPTQLVYEAADCRFFYTAEMHANQSLVWQKVYDIAWGNATCVPGSADHPSSLSGKLLSYQAAYPPVGANYTFGAKGQAWPNDIANPASSATQQVAPTIAPTGGKSLFAKSTTYLDGTASTSATTTTTSSQTAASAASSSSKSGFAVPTAAVGFSGLAGVGVALVAGLAL